MKSSQEVVYESALKTALDCVEYLTNDLKIPVSKDVRFAIMLVVMHSQVHAARFIAQYPANVRADIARIDEDKVEDECRCRVSDTLK